MASPESDRDSSTLGTWVPRTVAIVGGVGFIALGVWAMVGPRSFFAALATFEPYNQHFLQDVGAFQIGLGVVLLLAAVPVRADGLTVALVGPLLARPRSAKCTPVAPAERLGSRSRLGTPRAHTIVP